MGLAALGKREHDDGTYSRLSAAECVPARRQAGWIALWSILIAVAATAIIWAI
ncbi:MAG TPA: hypothetical protein VIP11_18270 [Gemmatimonadaceae bacterium]